MTLRDGTAQIVSNGSKWYGQKPDGLLPLFRTLKSNKIDAKRTYVDPRPVWTNETQPPANAALFGGNFEDVSHVFCIYTDSPRLIRALEVAINTNQKRTP